MPPPAVPTLSPELQALANGLGVAPAAGFAAPVKDDPLVYVGTTFRPRGGFGQLSSTSLTKPRSQVIAEFYNLPDSELRAFQAKAAAAGFYGTKPPRIGDYDEQTLDIWAAMVDRAAGFFAAGRKITPGAALDLAAGKAPAEAGQDPKAPYIIGGNVGGGATDVIRLSDPAALRAKADSVLQKVLGRKPTADQRERYVAELMAEEEDPQRRVAAAQEGQRQTQFGAQNSAEMSKAIAAAGADPARAAAAAPGSAFGAASPRPPGTAGPTAADLPGSRAGIINPVAEAKAGPADTMGANRDGGARKHKGTDIFGKEGSAAVAPIAGTVVKAGNGGKNAGLRVTIKGVDGRYHFLAHLQSVGVKVGQQLTQGAQIGTVGRTGNAIKTPAHVHYSINSTPNGEDAVGNPAKELSGQKGPSMPGLHGPAAGIPAAPTTAPAGSIIGMPNTYIPTVTTSIQDVDVEARLAEKARRDSPGEAGAHDLAGTYGRALRILGIGA